MLHQELLAQARHLARKEPKKPKEASLRRAISAAYYSLFHLLIHEAGRFLVVGRRNGLRNRLARSFEHGRMREAAQLVVGKQSSAPPKLKNVALAFVEIQQERHEADYSLTRKFRRSEVEARVSQAEGAVADWQAVRGQPEAESFLVSLLVKLR